VVNIYQWLFGKRGKDAMTDLADDPSGLLARHMDAIRATELPIIAIGEGDNDRLTPTASHLGGTPWWPLSQPYPRDDKGKPLYLLIQINFSDTPPLENFPTDGLLQIFIGTDEHYGCNLEDLHQPRGFRCLYHTNLTQSVLTDFAFLDSHSIEDTGFLPLDEPLRPLALSFESTTMPVTTSDYRFPRLLPTIEGDEELTEAFFEYASPPAIHLGGYPTFTQEDPRAYPQNPPLGDVTLLVVDTTTGIMWGDSGAAQFLIHADDLKRRDFSRVVYNWDCL
jgi:uncharacterized protein YwqG